MLDKINCTLKQLSLPPRLALLHVCPYSCMYGGREGGREGGKKGGRKGRDQVIPVVLLCVPMDSVLRSYYVLN